MKKNYSYVNKNEEIYTSNKLINKALLLDSEEISYRHIKRSKQLNYHSIKILKSNYILIKSVAGRGKTTLIDLLLKIRQSLNSNNI
tara:strand:- start:302 stop:559 length:258 start_codon:yes stop_codon:yes gene_type:complete